MDAVKHHERGRWERVGGGGHWNGGGEGVVVASDAVVVGHAGANAEKAPC